MTDADITVLRRLKKEYQNKLGFKLPKINSTEVKTWISAFNSFWRWVDPYKLAGDTPQLRRISAVFLMRDTGINVPEIVYDLMLARKMEIEAGL
jgi:hypothetical protein